MQEIIVSDANIFIDLYKIGLLDMFFKLPFKVHTTDFILHELRDMFLEKKVQEYIDREKLIIKCFSANEISSLMSFHPETQNRLSIQDRSIWFYAKGHRYVLLTGDNAKTAEFLASKVGIKKVFSGLLPMEKVEKIRELRAAGKNVCMIGDGVNDAPALGTADVGVAMGAMGSDIAVEAAEIALMSDDISRIPYLKRLSNAAVWLIKFNISLSMAINTVAITLSVMALLNPVTGALVHNLGSVLVVLNAGFLYDRNYIKSSRRGKTISQFMSD